MESGPINWKLKYQQLKLQFMESVDVAYRLGIENGMLQAQNEAAQQQKMQAQQNPQDQQSFGDNYQGSPAGEEQMGNPNAQNTHAAKEQPFSDQSELDKHITELESMLSKSELSHTDLKKVVDDLKKAQDLKKSSQAISGISKALHTPAFKISTQAQHNMSDNSKKALTMQHKIVQDIMAKWDASENLTSNKITDILSIEGILKKD